MANHQHYQQQRQSASSDWTGAPIHHHQHGLSKWTLQEIESGFVMNEHVLSTRPLTFLGRDPDQVDIVLTHESCSRKHARIAFDAATGTPWLLDLKSKFGTTVNQRPLPKEACRKEENHGTTSSTTPGVCRGVRLYPNDVLTFGASTRVYCLQGPPGFERGSITLMKSRETFSQFVSCDVCKKQRSYDALFQCRECYNYHPALPIATPSSDPPIVEAFPIGPDYDPAQALQAPASRSATCPSGQGPKRVVAWLERRIH